MMATNDGRNSGGGVYITIPQIQEVVGDGFSTRRLRRWLDRAGVLERRYGTVVTTPERLAVAFPEVYRGLVQGEDIDE